MYFSLFKDKRCFTSKNISNYFLYIDFTGYVDSPDHSGEFRYGMTGIRLRHDSNFIILVNFTTTQIFICNYLNQFYNSSNCHNCTSKFVLVYVLAFSFRRHSEVFASRSHDLHCIRFSHLKSTTSDLIWLYGHFQFFDQTRFHCLSQ